MTAFFIVTLVLFILAIRYMLVQPCKELHLYYELTKNGMHAQGTVVHLIEEIDPDNLKTYKPVIEFKAIDNKVHQYIPTDSTTHPPPIGKQMSLKYDTQNIDRVVISGIKTLAFILFKIFFVLFVFAGLFAGAIIQANR
jgi:hypothetical protein